MGLVPQAGVFVQLFYDACFTVPREPFDTPAPLMHWARTGASETRGVATVGKLDAPIFASFGLRQQLSQAPDVVSDARFHRCRHAEAFVYPADIVIGEVERTRGLVIVQLL